jgi:hypothetical protein
MMPEKTSAFVNSERNNLMLNPMMLTTPGPTEYIADQTKQPVHKETGDKRPFGVTSSRFKTIDHGVPGAGSYKLPDSCSVKFPKYEHASMRSTVTKGLNQVIGPNNPGVGEYDT